MEGLCWGGTEAGSEGVSSPRKPSLPPFPLRILLKQASLLRTFRAHFGQTGVYGSLRESPGQPGGNEDTSPQGADTSHSCLHKDTTALESADPPPRPRPFLSQTGPTLHKPIPPGSQTPRRGTRFPPGPLQRVSGNCAALKVSIAPLLYPCATLEEVPTRHKVVVARGELFSLAIQNQGKSYLST